jgi:hypothetical protein
VGFFRQKTALLIVLNEFYRPPNTPNRGLNKLLTTTSAHRIGDNRLGGKDLCHRLSELSNNITVDITTTNKLLLLLIVLRVLWRAEKLKNITQVVSKYFSKVPFSYTL